MTTTPAAVPASDRELVLTRLIDAPRAKLFRAWTDPKLLKQWFAPLPWTTASAELDVRPGGASLIVMRDPEGNEFPSRGVFLEVVKNERLVFTDAYIQGWEPSEKPFMTGILTFEDLGGKTRYTAGSVIGPSPIARRMRRWASTRAGVNAPTSSPHWSRSSEREKAHASRGEWQAPSLWPWIPAFAGMTEENLGEVGPRRRQT